MDDQKQAEVCTTVSETVAELPSETEETEALKSLPSPTSAPPVPPIGHIEEMDMSVSDSNLPSYQKHIMERLESIRINKQRILMTLRELKENAKEGELPDKKLMAKMISSYDALTVQEEEYVQLIQQIVNIRENAAEDVNLENVASGIKIVSECNGAGETETHTRSVKVKNCGESETGDEFNYDLQELNSELSNLGLVTGKAVAASIMNDKLLETLQLHHEKRATLEELRRKEREKQVGAANVALQQVEVARLKVASEQEQVERKHKTLQRLRREAQRRGIKLDPGSASEPDIVVESQPEPKSITEAKLRAKLQAKKKQNAEEEDDNGPPVPDDLAPTERIPPILENKESKTEQQQVPKSANEMGVNDGVAGKKRKKGKKSREPQQPKPSDAFDSSIREKLASIAARKERMREIRAQLVRPVQLMPLEMDETFRNAQQQLKSITEMRKQLELLREKGGQLPEETAQLLENQLKIEDISSKQSEKAIDRNASVRQDTEMPFGENIQAVTEKSDRDTAGTEMHNSLVQDDLVVGYRFTAKDSERLQNMEQALREQHQLLETIVSQNRQLQSAAPYQFKAVALRRCFLTAAPQLLTRLGIILLDLAKGEEVPELDSVLFQLLQNADKERIFGEINERKNEVNNEGHELTSTESESLETVELIKLVRGESGSRFDRELNRELTPEGASKFEKAKRQLWSGKAKLRKQQTLEKVRSRTEMVDEQQQKQDKRDVELGKDLERDICKIIDGIVPWIRSHGEVIASDESMRQLSDELLKQAPTVFSEGTVLSDLFRNQLSTIVDGTLSQYIGNKVAEVREELIFEISEILYNELAFFQLINTVNSVVD